MSLTVSATAEKTFTPIEEGTYLAVCFLLVDLGEQYNEKFQKSAHKVQIGWEIPEETIDVDGEKKPYRIYKEYTSSLGDRSTLRKDLASWRSRDFTPEELKGFKLQNIIGTSCLLNVTHSTSSLGKTYANVTGIMALPKGMPKGELSGAPITFDLDQDPLSKIDEIPTWIAEKIKKSNTYKERLALSLPELEELGTGDPENELPF